MAQVSFVSNVTDFVSQQEHELISRLAKMYGFDAEDASQRLIAKPKKQRKPKMRKGSCQAGGEGAERSRSARNAQKKLEREAAKAEKEAAKQAEKEALKAQKKQEREAAKAEKEAAKQAEKEALRAEEAGTRSC